MHSLVGEVNTSDPQQPDRGGNRSDSARPTDPIGQPDPAQATESPPVAIPSEVSPAEVSPAEVSPAEVSPTSATPQANQLPRSRFPLLLLGLFALLTVVTGAVLFLPGFLVVAIAPQADHVINTFAALVAGAVAVLAWIRFRETEQLDSLLQSSAFLVLFVGGVISLAMLLTGSGTGVGFDRSAPGQAPLYLWTVQRLVAAPLLLIGALVALTDRGWTPSAGRSLPLLAMLAPSALVLIATAAIVALHDQLPTLIPTPVLERITQPLDDFDAGLLSEPMLASQLIIAGLYVAAGLAYGWSYLRGRRLSQRARPYDAYLSVGLVVAAFSQIHFAIVPGAYEELVTSGDLLRITFYSIVGLGIAAAARHDLRELEQANITLQHLRVADSKRIAIEERARLARDVHDGLVQDLWLARLTHGQLTQILEQSATLTPESRQAAERLDGILEDALSEARQAVVSLQPQEDASFGNVLRRFIEDHADRFGLEVECSVNGPPLTQLPGQVQAEILRIGREAMNNARKHADATLVQVSLDSEPQLIRLIVADNGRGFHSNRPQRRGFGLRSMQERAAGIGGRLEVDSQPMSGTRVILELPQPQFQPSEGGPA